MNETELIIQAIDGIKEAFDALVHRRYAEIRAFLKKEGAKDAEADDICQEVFIALFLNIKKLRDPGAFQSWIYRIARRQFWSHSRKEPKTVELNEEVLTDAAPLKRGAQRESEALLRRKLALLSPDAALLLELQVCCNCSYRDLSQLLNLPEKRIKSRLFEARKMLKKQLASVSEETLEREKTQSPYDHQQQMENLIMEKTDFIYYAAYTLTRLSLKDQVELALHARDNALFSDELISAISETRKGVEFIQTCQKKISFKELVTLLNHVDRYTEIRIITELDHSHPEFGEQIKQNMFIMEDCVLLSKGTIEKLIRRCDQRVLQMALKEMPGKIIDHMLSPLSAEEQKQWREDIVNLNMKEQNEILICQNQVIETLKQMEEEGEVQIQRQQSDTGKEIAFS